MMRLARYIAALAAGAALAACAPATRPAPVSTASPVSALRFIGELRVAHRAMFGDTMLGGFSGLDYDPASGRWLVESDDRCTASPARYYDAELDIDATALRALRFTGQHYFLNADGKDFAAASAGCSRLW